VPKKRGRKPKENATEERPQKRIKVVLKLPEHTGNDIESSITPTISSADNSGKGRKAKAVGFRTKSTKLDIYLMYSLCLNASPRCQLESCKRSSVEDSPCTTYGNSRKRRWNIAETTSVDWC